MNNMFDNCQNLERLDLTSLNTRNVVSFVYFLHNCYSFTSIDLSRFDTGNGHDISGMFLNCQ